jgi:hypothetical protein
MAVAEVSAVTRMNIAALDGKAFRELHAYFAASAGCAANPETLAEAVRYLAAFDDEARLRSNEASR